MSKYEQKRIVYTDPIWAIGGNGKIVDDWANLESSILSNGFTVETVPIRNGAFVKSGPDLLEKLHGAHAVVVYRTEVNREFVDAVRATCKVIARQGVGYDNLDMQLLRESGIYSFNVPDYCIDEVTDHALGLVLALERGVCVQNAHLKLGHWDVFKGGRPRRLSHLTFGIIGFGRIGRAMSFKVKPIYRNLLAFDPYVHSDVMAAYGVQKAGSLVELLASCDVVSLHADLNEVSRFMINQESIRAMKPDALLINTARGQLVSPEAVLGALQQNRIGGYGCDVFSPENPSEDEAHRQIMSFENVVVTSHRAFLSRESELSLRRRVAEQLLDILLNDRPPQFGRLA